MRGGNRLGAGRKVIPESEKKKRKSVYITDKLYTRIMDTDIENCNNFSQKCMALIELAMENLNKNNQEHSVKRNNILMVREPKSTYNKTNNNFEKQNSGIKLTFIDLFAGIGGIRLGFEDKYTKCVFSSEWDKYAAQTYEANYGEKPHGDITKINENDIPDHDVLLAGFPCQPFSNIGKREGFAHETQGTLFFDVLRILKKKQPKMFLLENVKGLLTNDNGNTFRVILDNLKSLGYSVFYEVMDAQNFGLPQRRERIVIVGFHPDLGINDFSFPKGNPDNKVPINAILEHNPTGYSISKRLQESYLFKKDDGKPQIVDFDSTIQVNTLVASYHKIQRLTGTFVKDGETGLRLFSELELKRLMGFPDDFKVPVSRTQMYRQFGNSVAVPMIKAVAKAMKERLLLAEMQDIEKIKTIAL
ncbi:MULTISPECIES: DNA cytosine methyltransferase [Ruminiclostridium]|uniref:Cytosine-specific methyltransferase n=2 Tax=Ruminiclostridium TaxID=1508657 RepID=A0A4U7J821_9FIRM|nr:MULTISPECIES: DNA cytosine methyltransferase [Ruminiclostridium]ACL77161.1 DNA-cytosine methyltransferase [Ruminiclostridium cellulolyticum H10]QNU66425.1 DNA cytosine methyltransferase [Ruminiclostridium herbifermentans]